VTRQFKVIAERAGLPVKRLHDLRHGSASMQLAAGVDIAVVSKRLGHSTIALTADTYSHLLRGVGADAAERSAALVPRRRPATAAPPVHTSCTREAFEPVTGLVPARPTTRTCRSERRLGDLNPGWD